MSCVLAPIDANGPLDELRYLGLWDGSELPEAFQTYLHREGNRTLIVTFSIDRVSLETMNEYGYTARRWRHVGVGVAGSLNARLADRRKLGRGRAPGERSPVPLPDWYDLTHVVYGHPELGFDMTRPVFQLLPPPGAPYLNMAEVLHLRQPL
ncbi:MAG TPA: hypothetical protein VIV06_11410 [Candidatus Limnocylindrales bacterium]